MLILYNGFCVNCLNLFYCEWKLVLVKKFKINVYYFWYILSYEV